MNEFGRLPMPLALLGLLLLAAFLALFWGAAAGLAARISKTLLSRAFMLASFLTLAEWLRGEGLADFAWLTPALALLDTSLEGLAPLGGAHLINFAFFTSLAALAVLATHIAQNAVTAQKIAPGAVTADKIAAGAIITALLAPNAVTAEKLANDIPYTKFGLSADQVRHVYAGTTEPGAELGSDGDIYLMYSE